MRVLDWICRKWQARNTDPSFEQHVIVTATDQDVRAVYPDGASQHILWKNVDCVAIETNDSGPSGADFWWLFEGDGNRCCYPDGATGQPDLLPQMAARFPGFDFQKFIQATACTSNARFVCWERKAADH